MKIIRTSLIISALTRPAWEINHLDYYGKEAPTDIFSFIIHMFINGPAKPLNENISIFPHSAVPMVRQAAEEC